MADLLATSVDTIVPSLENNFSNIAQGASRARSSSMVSIQGVQVDIDDAVDLVKLFDFVAATIVLAGSINEGNLSFQSTCERYNTASDVPASSQENNDNSQYQITPSTDHFPVNMNISQFITFDDGTRIKVIQSIVNDLKNNQTEITELQGVGKLLRDFWMVYTQKKQLHEVKYLGLVQRSNHINNAVSESQENAQHDQENFQKKKRFNASSWWKRWNKKSGNTTGLNQLDPAKETSNAHSAVDNANLTLNHASDTNTDINKLVNDFLEEYICKVMRDTHQVTAEIVDSMPRNNSTKLENNSPQSTTLKFTKLPDNAQQQEIQDSEKTQLQAEELNNNLQGAHNEDDVNTHDPVIEHAEEFQNKLPTDHKGNGIVTDGLVVKKESSSVNDGTLKELPQPQTQLTSPVKAQKALEVSEVGDKPFVASDMNASRNDGNSNDIKSDANPFDDSGYVDNNSTAIEAQILDQEAHENSEADSTLESDLDSDCDNDLSSDNERECNPNEKDSNVVTDGDIADDEESSDEEVSPNKKNSDKKPVVMAIKPQEKEGERLETQNRNASLDTFNTDTETKTKTKTEGKKHSVSNNESDQVLKGNLMDYLKSKWTGKGVSWLKRLLGAIARFFKRCWSGGAKKDFSTQSIKMVNELLKTIVVVEEKSHESNGNDSKGTLNADTHLDSSAKHPDALIDRFKKAHTKLLSDYMKQHCPKKISVLEVTEKKEEAQSALKRNINYYGARLYACLPKDETSKEGTQNATDFSDCVLKALASNG